MSQNKAYHFNLGLTNQWIAAVPANSNGIKEPLAFLQVTNTSTNTERITVKLNEDEECAFVIDAGVSQVFNWDDAQITTVHIYNNWASGWVSGVSTASVQVILAYTSDVKPTITTI